MSAHDDYLDPDLHLWQSEDYVGDILKAFSDHGYRVDESRSEVKIGGDYYGESGRHTIKIVYADDEVIKYTVHGVKQVDFDPQWSNDDQELAQEIVMVAASQGEWTGDDWVLFYDSNIFTTHLVEDDDGEIDYRSTINTIVMYSTAELASWVDEMTMVHEGIVNIDSNYD